ncbi:hypothetical protein AVEN_194699-1 [Araneus ventricosus]|uniref:Uncharacterized protein n=1 Tax=Araneus ventricosus TaxID=182803 RepID=A0A4Y2FYC9_ARAVE|nr:hypothetical protein AVEN_194699-1 [Araneus ventricosus]
MKTRPAEVEEYKVFYLSQIFYLIHAPGKCWSNNSNDSYLVRRYLQLLYINCIHIHFLQCKVPEKIKECHLIPLRHQKYVSNDVKISASVHRYTNTDLHSSCSEYDTFGDERRIVSSPKLYPDDNNLIIMINCNSEPIG